jgi:broad specificity phosphatase PhoE
MVLRPKSPEGPWITEAEVVYLADKVVADDEVVGLDERQARTIRKMRPGPQAAQRIAERMRDARTIGGKVSAILGRSLEDLLQELAQMDLAPRQIQVFLVRHAEPATPPGRRYLGQADAALADAGEEQARRLAGRLMEMTGGACFDVVYSSDLRRALRTAEIITDGCTTPVRAERWLREIDVGSWEGLSWEEAKRDYPAEYAARELDLVGRPFPDGESFRDLQARVLPRFLQLVDAGLTAGHRRTLVVGHKGVNRVILAHFRGLPLEDLFSIEQGYAEVIVLRFDAGGATVPCC